MDAPGYILDVEFTETGVRLDVGDEDQEVLEQSWVSDMKNGMRRESLHQVPFAEGENQRCGLVHIQFEIASGLPRGHVNLIAAPCEMGALEIQHDQRHHFESLWIIHDS